MTLIRHCVAFMAAAHPGPTVAVTTVMTVYAWSVGWRGGLLVLVGVTVFVGQLSIGWSNDAADARSDARAGRRDKPTVSGAVTPRSLWVAAAAAVSAASALSWAVAGPVGGSLHVLALGMAWLYNLALSRSVWSWLPYAVAFGALPLFVSIGLDGDAGPVWPVAVFVLLAVSAHLANALRDLEPDRRAGIDGLAVRLGARRTTALCWALLGAGTAILAAVCGRQPYGAALVTVLVVGYLAALVYATSSRRPAAMFHALLVVAVVDVVVLSVASAL